MKPLILAISGKKQSGKSSLCDYIRAWYNVKKYNLNVTIIQDFDGSIRFFDISKTDVLCDGENQPLSEDSVYGPLADKNPVKIYSFADALKDICIRILGLPWEQCYGSDKDKNSLTKFYWDNLPEQISLAYSESVHDVGTGYYAYNDTGDPVEFYETIKLPRSGKMSAREVMQVLGTDVFRRMFSDTVWVDSTFGKIEEESKDIALIADCRFPSEVKAIIDNGGYIIRLNRVVDDNDQHPSETALDDFPFAELGDKCLIIENDNYPIEKKNELASEWVEDVINRS